MVERMMPDKDQCAEALYQSLKGDAFYRTLEAHVAGGRDPRAAMLAYYKLSMQDGIKWGRATFPEDGDYGASVWSLPLSEDASAQRTSEKQAALKAALGPEATGVFNQIESEMAPHENMLNLHDNWYLSILGLHPSQQGKGLGAVLLRPVLDEADKAGVASYLTTFSQGNIKFYEKVGFEVMGQFPVPATGSDFSVLVRPPRPV